MNSFSSAPILLTGANQAAFVGQGSYKGITVRETAGAVAVIRIYDNAAAASGKFLGVYNLPASGSLDIAHLSGRRFENGVFVNIVSGTVEGSVFV